MNPEEVLQNLNALLQSVDERLAPESESSILDNIKQLIDVNLGNEAPLEWRAEYIAFLLGENHAGTPNDWGTYLGPAFMFYQNDGSILENPDRKSLVPEMIEYWSRRAEESQHPLLKARYYGLIWDFSKPIAGNKPSHEIAIAYIQNLLLIAETNLHTSATDIMHKLDRALSLSILLNFNDLVIGCKDAILSYERKLIASGQSSPWGFSFDLLLGNRKVTLSQEEEKCIIDNFESRLQSLYDNSEDRHPDPYSIEPVIQRLSKYYQTENRIDDIKRVIGKLGDACEGLAKTAAPIMTITLFQRLYAIYREFHLYEEANRIAVRIRELGAGIDADLKEFSHAIQIPKEEFDKYLESITEGGINKAIPRIASHYISRQDMAKEQLLEFAKEFPMRYLISTQITDHRGRIVAVIGSLDEDIDGHIIHHMIQDMARSAAFLNAVIEHLINRYELTSDDLLNFLLRSPIFHIEKQEFLRRGIEFYLGGDYISSIHLLMPQIEGAIRELVELSGGAILKPSRHGGYVLINLDELLRHKIVKTALGDDITYYLRALLTDQRGSNMRNNVCHGISPSVDLNKFMADRVMHALFCLSLLRSEQNES